MKTKTYYQALIEFLSTGQLKDRDFFDAGFGQLKDFLDPANAGNLKDDVTTAETAYINKYGLESFNRFKSSLLTSYFTPSEITDAITSTLPLRKNGIYRVLEPSAGTGNFARSILKYFPNVDLTAIEKDSLSADILGARIDQANVINTGFEEFKSFEKFDVVISNIPFGDFKIYDPNYQSEGGLKKKATTKIHNYFFLKSLDHLDEGGLLIFIAPAGFSDSQSNEEFRNYLVSKGDLKFFNRLPVEIFKDSGTKASSDLIVIQKNSEKKKVEIKSFELQFASTERRSTISLNELLAKRSRLGYGNPVIGGQYRKSNLIFESRETIQEISDGIKERLLNALWTKQKIEPGREIEGGQLKDDQRVIDDSQSLSVDERAEKIKLPDFYVNGNLVIDDNDIYSVERLDGEHDSGYNYKLIATEIDCDIDQAYVLFNIRDTYKRLLELEASEQPGSGNADQIRKKLNLDYDYLIQKYGPINESLNRDLADLDVEGFKLLSLENKVDNEWVRAEIFTRSVSGRAERKIEDIESGILHSLDSHGYINLEFIATNLGVSVEYLLNEGLKKEVLFYDPVSTSKNGIVPKDEFLSGDVVGKISKLREEDHDKWINPFIESHIKSLRAVEPNKLPLELIDLQLGERWIKREVYSGFASSLFGVDCDVNYLKSQDRFVIKLHSYSSESANTYSTAAARGKYYGHQVLEYAMVDYIPSITKTVYVVKDGEKQEKKIPDTEKIRQFEMVVREMKKSFKSYISSDKEIKEYIENEYHRLFNNIVLRQYDGSHLTFPGLTNFKPRKHQKNGAWMILQRNGGIVDHKVGAGKTLVIAMAAMEMRRIGLAKKPCVIGMKSNTESLKQDFMLAYPNAKILCPSERDFTPKNRRVLLQRIMNQDWDCVMMTHDQFNRIPQSPEMTKKVISSELEDLKADLDLMSKDNTSSKRELKGLEKRKMNLEVRLKEMNDKLKRDEDIISFDMMGIDHLMVDESQIFKNLTFTTRHTQVSGMGSPKGSQRAFNMLIAARTLQEKHKGDKGITFLSGTPISNSLVELYLLFKYLRPNAIQEKSIDTFDSWASIYAIRSTDYEFSVTGEVKPKQRFREYIKVPELAKFYKEITDVVNKKNLSLDEPELEHHLVELEPSVAQLNYNQELIKFAQSKGDYPLEGAKVGENHQQAYMLIATGLSKKMSLDLRMIDSLKYDLEPNGKLDSCAKNIKVENDSSSEYKGTQLVFCDVGTPGKDKKFVVYNELVNVLVDYGIPEHEIAIIHDYNSKKKKEKLFQMVNDGDIRVLIGSTTKMGIGVNVQKRVIAMHHLELPWRPSDFEQRTGRGARQKNWAAKEFRENRVANYVYATKRSLDPYQFQLLATKQKFINQIKDASIKQRKIDEGAMGEDGSMNFAEYVALLSGNQELLEKTRLEKKLNAIEREYEAFLASQSNARVDIEWKSDELLKAGDRIKSSENDLSAIRKMYEAFDEKRNEFEFPKTVVFQDSEFKNPKKLGEAMHKCEQKVKDFEYSVFGSYGPFKIVAKRDFDEVVWAVGGSKLKYTYSHGSLNDNNVLAGKYIHNALMKVEGFLKGQKEYESNLKSDIVALNKKLESKFERVSVIEVLKRQIEEINIKLDKGIDSPEKDQTLGKKV